MTLAEKIETAKKLKLEYDAKLKQFNALRAELDALRREKLSWYTGTVDDVVTNWIAIKGVLNKIKQGLSPEEAMKEMKKKKVSWLPLALMAAIAFMGGEHGTS